MGKGIPSKWARKQSGLSALMPEKMDFRMELIRGGLENVALYSLKNNHQEDIVILNIYEPNTGIPNFIKQILLGIKPQINSNTENSR